MLERRQRAQQLVGLRPVFGIVHHYILAAGELHRVVECLGLGSRRPVRNDHSAKVARQPHGQDRGLRLSVDGLEDEQDFELGPRIGEGLQGLHQTGEHFGFPEQRNHDRVQRQGLRQACDNRTLPAHVLARRSDDLPQRNDAQQRHAKKGHGDDPRQCGNGGAGKNGETSNDESDSNGGGYDLPNPYRARSGTGRLITKQAADSVSEPLGPQMGLQRRVQAETGAKCDVEPLRLQMRHPLAQHIRRLILGT